MDYGVTEVFVKHDYFSSLRIKLVEKVNDKLFLYEDKGDKFYDGEGNELPTEAVTALVRSQYVVTNKTEDSLINKYFK